MVVGSKLAVVAFVSAFKIYAVPSKVVLALAYDGGDVGKFSKVDIMVSLALRGVPAANDAETDRTDKRTQSIFCVHMANFPRIKRVNDLYLFIRRLHRFTPVVVKVELW